VEPLMNDAISGQIYSDGWRKPAGGTREVHEPATGRVLGSTGIASAEDVEAAVESAVRAQDEWARWGGPRRGEVMRSAARLLEEHREEFIEFGMRECGAIRGKAENEVQGSIGEILEAAGLATAPYGDLLPSDSASLSMARRVPLGVVGIIAPWNFPLILAMRSVAPALVLGNAVLLKPDVNTPIFGGSLIARLFEEAGLPPGVLHVLPGGPETGEALVTAPGVDMISFTGSTATGRKVAQAAAAQLKKVSLELGGNNAHIVLEDADLEKAASTGAWGSFLHQGQICLTTGRHLVHEALSEAYVDKLVEHAKALRVGDPTDPETAIGPIINQQQLHRVSDIVERSVSAGARVRTGGESSGLFYQPTVLDQIDTQTPAFREEIFGPVAPVISFSDDADAVRLANDSEYGLTAAIQTSSLGRALDIARSIKSGMVHINDTTVNDAPYVPFGGMGDSGSGARHGGTANLDEYTQWQWVTVHDSPVEYPF
jgi:benzaldehyde dehydrogenase (NAD)